MLNIQNNILLTQRETSISKFNAFILILQLVDITISKLVAITKNPILGYYNEFVLMIVVFMLLTTVINRKGRISKDIIYAFILLAYSIFQILLRGLPLSHIMQGIIYIEFLLYFIYFNGLSLRVRIGTLKYVAKYFKYFLVIVLIFVFINIYDPAIIRNALTTGRVAERGIYGFYLQSIFGSTTGLSQFCLLLLFIYYIYNVVFGKKLFNNFMMVIVILTGLLSFSRKEVSLLIFFLFMMIHIFRNGRIIIRKLIIPIAIMVGLLGLYISLFFVYANQVAKGEDYVRTQMADFSIQITEAYFPFGSGPGTFGSQMSVKYTKVYDQFNVGQNITGYDGKRGPIYDAFLFTFMAEQGIGLLIYIGLIVYMCRKKPLFNLLKLKYLKIFIGSSLLIIGIFAPVLMNDFGLICFAILGLTSAKDSDPIYSENKLPLSKADEVLIENSLPIEVKP